MTPKQLASKLSDSGCCAQVMDVTGPIFVGSIWVEGDDLVWTALPAENQSDVHRHEIVKSSIVHGRDLQIEDTGGRRVYFAPIEEWPNVDQAEYLGSHTEWKEAMKKKRFAKNVQEFIIDSVGIKVSV